jgi:hypothetical protein
MLTASTNVSSMPINSPSLYSLQRSSAPLSLAVTFQTNSSDNCNYKKYKLQYIRFAMSELALYNPVVAIIFALAMSTLLVGDYLGR